jgi:hypothetical protein
MTYVIGDGNTGGCTFGASVTEKVSFYGVTPIVQPAPAVTVGTDLATVILELADLRAQFLALGLIEA